MHDVIVSCAVIWEAYAEPRFADCAQTALVDFFPTTHAQMKIYTSVPFHQCLSLRRDLL